MSARLIKPSIQYKEEYIEMIEEWNKTGENMVPFILRYDYTNFDHFLTQMENLKEGIGLKPNTVSSSSYWFVSNLGEVIGAVNIRHRLNERLKQIGGHIGYGIRPTYRMKGYANELLRQALQIVKGMGINRALLTCDKDNIASAKTIMNNGGLLDSEGIVAGVLIQRYWINVF